MSATPVWSIVGGVIATGIIVFGIYAHHLIHVLLDVTQPCQHDGIWTGTECSCVPVWKGTYCEISNCSNRGKPIQDDDIWNCQCGSIRSDAGRLCDKCYTEDCSKRVSECIWPADITVGGRRCNQICMPEASSFDCEALDLGRDGACIGCNGHGVCGSPGECI